MQFIPPALPFFPSFSTCALTHAELYFYEVEGCERHPGVNAEARQGLYKAANYLLGLRYIHVQVRRKRCWVSGLSTFGDEVRGIYWSGN